MTFPPHLSVFLICGMTHHISTLHIFPLRSQRTACHFKNFWQVHTLISAHYPPPLTKVCTMCSQVHIFNTYVEVYMSSSSTAEPTEKKTYTQANTYWETYTTDGICPAHSAVATVDNTLHWTRTHQSLRTSGHRFVCFGLLASLSKPEWKSWELNVNLDLITHNYIKTHNLKLK